MLSFKRNGAPFLRNGCADFAEYATDSSVIANMPENYDDYIERMDSAVEAYMRRTGMPDEEVFELRRPDME